MSEQEYREAIAHYWGFCTMQDDLLGMVLDELDATGQANTVVIFTSDHGDYAGAHGLFMKGVAAADECYRSLLVRWPAGITDPGRSVEQFVSLADFAPRSTGRKLGGAEAAQGISGQAWCPSSAAKSRRTGPTLCIPSSTAWRRSTTRSAWCAPRTGSTSTTVLTTTSYTASPGGPALPPQRRPGPPQPGRPGGDVRADVEARLPGR